jgi:holo-[acyl-carrier protein] synthase
VEGGVLTARVPASQGRGGPSPPPGSLIGLGLDLVDVERFRSALGRRPALAERLFTAVERAIAGDGPGAARTLAGRFAVKEAVMKALGVGIGAVDWTDISAGRRPGGAPELEVAGRAAERAARLGVASWLVSVTHTDTVAAAVVVALA